MRLYPGLGLVFGDLFAVQVFYHYSVRDSNMEEFDITDSRIELHLKLNYQFNFDL